MAFARRPYRAPAPSRPRGPVFAVGQRVYVACPANRSATVTLKDEADKTSLANVGDGTEVAILAWRPGWSGAARYRVRATDSSFEGWLAVDELRAAAVPSPPSEPPPAAVAPAPVAVPTLGRYGRRFGQR